MKNESKGKKTNAFFSKLFGRKKPQEKAQPQAATDSQTKPPEKAQPQAPIDIQTKPEAEARTQVSNHQPTGNSP